VIETKTCEGCGAQYERPPNARNWNWGQRRFCSRGCGARVAAMDPAHRKKCGDGLRARLASDPEAKARHTAAAKANIAKGRPLSDRKKSGATRSRNTLGWLPDAETRKLYIRLREQYGAAKAKEMVKESMAVAARREVRRNQQEMDRRHRRELEQRY